MTIKFWDIETTTTTYMKRKASPFCADNWVVTHAFARKGEAPKEYRFGSSRPPDGWFKQVLEGTNLLCGFNIKFDILHALTDSENLDAWIKYVARGGMVWDCQLAEYLLEGMTQENHMLSLDEVAPRYGGNVKIDEVKALWQAGVNTQDIEPSLLSRYLCGGDDEFGVFQKGDIGNTELIAMGQIARARACGQVNSIILNMGSLLCTIEMERNGLYVDKALGLKLAAELQEAISKMRAALSLHLPQDLPFEFNWGSRIHKSALIFGGTVMYDSREYVHEDGSTTRCDLHTPGLDKPIAYAKKDELQYVLEDGTTTSVPPSSDDLASLTSYAVFKSGKNAGEFKTKRVKVDDLTKPKARNCKTPYHFKGVTEPKKEWASDTPGVYSVSSEVIEELGNRNIPFLKALAELQAATKDLGTYFIVTDPETGESKGMLSLIGADGLIHHSINHTSTVTGRFSASNPNSQNIPKGKKSKVKQVFVSRFGEDGAIVQSDFTALEIYVQAILTKCKQLIQDLIDGLDMHCLRLANKEGMPYEEVYKLCKGYVDEAGKRHPIVEEWDYKRTDAKVYSFQAAYGAGDQKISDSTGMPIETVAAFRAADDKRYPEINEYFSSRAKEIQANRRDTNRRLPHPEVPGVICHLGESHVRTPDGKLYSYKEQPSPAFLCKKGKPTSFSPTEIKNYEVQGEGGEWAKAAMYLAIRAFYARGNFGGKALLINQVHDALYGDFHNDVKLEAAALLHACMESASDYMEFMFKWNIPVPVPSDTTWGRSMAVEEPIDGIKELAATYRQELRTLYMGGYVPSFAH